MSRDRFLGSILESKAPGLLEGCNCLVWNPKSPPPRSKTSPSPYLAKVRQFDVSGQNSNATRKKTSSEVENIVFVFGRAQHPPVENTFQIIPFRLSLG